jgi:hypothetical protein
MQTIVDKPNTLLKVVGLAAILLAFLSIGGNSFLRPLLFAALIVLGVIVAILIGLTVWGTLRFPRMSYSEEGAAAFLRLVEEIRTDLKEETSIAEIEGRWIGGYPKLTLLFVSDDALREAQSTGLLDRIAKKLERVKHDPAFGPTRNRETFDPQYGIEAMTVGRRRLEQVIPLRFEGQGRLVARELLASPEAVIEALRSDAIFAVDTTMRLAHGVGFLAVPEVHAYLTEVEPLDRLAAAGLISAEPYLDPMLVRPWGGPLRLLACLVEEFPPSRVVQGGHRVVTRERLGQELVGAVGRKADLFALYEKLEGSEPSEAGGA